MIKAIRTKLQKFKQGEKGGVLIFVAMSLLPLLLMVGLAVDTSYGLVQKRKLQMAVDAAAKAGSEFGDSIAGQINISATKMFNATTANMTGITGPNIVWDSTTGCVTVSASINVPTNFMQLGGITSANYSATSSACLYGNKSEVAIVLDLSSTNGNWTSKMIDALKTFVTTIPNTTMVSIVPITTQIALDSSTTIPSSLFSHLSNTTNDENSSPALYPLSGNYAWNAANYGAVYNYLYGNTFPNSTSYYPLPGTCTGWGGPGTYLACSALYPLICSVGHTSCRANYSYTGTTMPPILPLTANQTTLTNYLTYLGNVNMSNHDVWPSLIVWGWRAIAPEYKDFWLINPDPTKTQRSSGTYPSVYSTNNPKNIVLVVTGGTTWNSTSLTSSYNSVCGAGLTKWQMTNYGALPLTSEKSTFVDITCDNYNYKTIDQTLGLNLSTTNYFSSTQTSTEYGNSVVSELNAKFLRICSNIKAKGTHIYVITQYEDTTLQQCASSTASPFYQVTGNGTPFVNIAATNVAGSVGGTGTVQR